MNIDEFLDGVAPRPQVPSQAAVQVPVALSVPGAQFSRTQTISVSRSDESNTLQDALDRFDSLALTLDTSLANADYQHGFETYIALQSALSKMLELQKEAQSKCQERLAQFKKKLFDNVQSSATQYEQIVKDLFNQIGQIKTLIDAKDLAGASTQYQNVKKAIDQIPSSFADKKNRLQDDLLKVYLYLKDKKDQGSQSEFSAMMTDMKNLYVEAVAAIKSGNRSQAQKNYDQLCVKYASLPDGFAEQKVHLFDYITFLHSQLHLDGAQAQMPEPVQSWSPPLAGASVAQDVPSLQPMGQNPSIVQSEQPKSAGQPAPTQSSQSPFMGPSASDMAALNMPRPKVNAAPTLDIPSPPAPTRSIFEKLESRPRIAPLPFSSRNFARLEPLKQPAAAAKLVPLPGAQIPRPTGPASTAPSAQLQARAKVLAAKLEELKKNLKK